MANPRVKTNPPSSPAGDAAPEFDELCPEGCFAEGVPHGAESVGCEHGTFAVTEKTKRQAAPVPERRPETVHDRDLHEPGEETIAPDSGAVKHLLGAVNGHDERILVLEQKVRTLTAAVEELVARATAQEPAPAEATGE